MGRDELEQHIRENMHNEDAVDAVEINGPLCQQCGSEIDIDTAHAVHRVPEHGGEMTESAFCDPSCLYDFWKELLEI